MAVWHEGVEVVADAPDLNIHAFGSDADAAPANLAVRIVDHFERLEELGDRLAPRLRRERNRLRQLLVASGAWLYRSRSRAVPPNKASGR